MPDADNTLYLCDHEAPNLQGLRSLSCLPGRAAVLMHSGVTRNGLYMPSSGRLNPDMGILVQASIEDGPAVNSEVVVNPYHGLWRDGWHDGRQLRLYGVSCPWYESIIAVRTPLGLEPTWDWVLLKREDTPNYNLLPDSLRYSTSRAAVQQIGPRASMLPLNARVIFKEGLNKKAFTFAFGADPALMLVREKDILVEIVDES